MSKYFNLCKWLSFFLLGIFLIGACNDDNTKDGNTNSSPSTDEGPPRVVKAGLTGGTLDALYTDSAAFNKLKHKVVFSFVFRGDDILTLDGWEDKNPFDPDPNIELYQGYAVTGVNYGLGTYFGDVVLGADDVNQIKREIKNKYKYVLFTPNTTDVPNHIRYKISYSNIKPEKVETLILPATELYANPSPPRAY
jgi:hypothetical protein